MFSSIKGGTKAADDLAGKMDGTRPAGKQAAILGENTKNRIEPHA
jgi:hypothetical protein